MRDVSKLVARMSKLFTTLLIKLEVPTELF